MATTERTTTAHNFLQWPSFDALRRRLNRRRALAILSSLTAAVAVLIIAAFNWGWLVASGTASVLLTVLPCLVMCALGLCMAKLGGGAGNGAIGSTGSDGSADLRPAASGSLPAGDPSCCHQGRHPSPATASTNDAPLQPKERNDA